MPPPPAPVCVVTGANSGIGKAATRLLAERGARIVMVCRSRERAEGAVREIENRVAGAELDIRLADLASLDHVRRLAAGLRDDLDGLDVLVNSAGVYAARRRITADGFERTLAVNHLAHFLLTLLLLPLLEAGRARVVTVSSDAHRTGKLRRAPLERILRGDVRYRGFRAYADSKLANVLFAFELARRTAGSGIRSNALHPGMLATRIWNQNRNLGSLLMRLYKPFMGSPEVGGEAVARLALDDDTADATGRYFDRTEEATPSADARDEALAAELWETSAASTGL